MASGFTCTSGALFAGNPTHTNPMLRPADGTGLLEDPPFPYRTLVFSSGQVITHNGSEIWRANLSDGKLHRVAGSESNGQALITGPCADARFSNIFSIVLATDGSLYVSDQAANAILKVTLPLGAGCTVSHIAGTPMDIPAGTITPINPPNVGNVDGAGATAKLELPERLAIDASNNLYVWDAGNDSIRKIASDGAHTLSTLLASIGGAAVLSQTILNGKLYVWGHLGNDIILLEVDTTSGTRREVLRSRATLFDGNSSDSQAFGGVVTDGTALIVFFNGQLFRVTTAGVVSPALAGVYRPTSFGSGYDPQVVHPAAALQMPTTLALVATAGVEAYLAIDADKNLYVTALQTNPFVVKVSCHP